MGLLRLADDRMHIDHARYLWLIILSYQETSIRLSFIRNKMCKNLKAMFKQVITKMELPSMPSIRKLKLYGLQFYNNEAFVYSLSKPCDNSYVFAQDFKFSILGESSALTQSMPTFSRTSLLLATWSNQYISFLISTVDEAQVLLND